MKILIIDDEKLALSSVKRLLKHKGIRNVTLCDNGEDGLIQMEQSFYDIVLLDLIMPGIGGIEILEIARSKYPLTEFIVLTALDEVDSSVKAIRLGAYDYLVKPVENQRLLLTIQRAYERQCMLASVKAGMNRVALSKVPDAFSHVITQSPKMLDLLTYANIMARSNQHVLITGESGTGKELLAQGIHKASIQKEGPFIPINMATLPESLFESQLFGHRKGAFTGAVTSHKGFFEQANSGTLFLDEIGELPLQLQPKLLRVLEEKQIYRLGETQPISINVRVIAATNKDLDQASNEGGFRLDLLYRLNSVHIAIPPLSQRKEDISLLVNHFIQRLTPDSETVPNIAPETIQYLCDCNFKGNVRELRQIIQKAIFICKGEEILPSHLDSSITPSADPFRRTLCSLKDNENAHVVYVLKQVRGDKHAAARILGVTVRHVQRKCSSLKSLPEWKQQLNDIYVAKA